MIAGENKPLTIFELNNNYVLHIIIAFILTLSMDTIYLCPHQGLDYV